MKSADTHQKVNIDQCIRKLNKIHQQRLGPVGPALGMLLIIVFALVLLPLFLFLKFFNVVYFWIRRQSFVLKSG